TFAVVSPQNWKTIGDAIYNANQNTNWYRDNNYPNIAAQITEYGFAYCQFSYSLPRPVTELFHLMMRVNYGDYFKALGFNKAYYDPATKEFDKEKIEEKINRVIERWRAKYPKLKLKTEKIKYDNMMNFNESFTTEIEFLNLETSSK